MKINKNIILLSAISFNVALSIALVKSFLSIYLHEIGITLVSIGLIYAAGAIAAGILRLPLGGLISKYGPKPLMIIGAACYPLFAIGVSIAETTPFFIVLKIIFEIVGAVFWTAFWVYLYDTIIKGEEGRSITFTGVFRKMPFFIGPFIAGIVISLFGFKNLFYLSAVIGIISVFVVSMVKDYPRRKMSMHDIEQQYASMLHVDRIKAILLVAAMHEMIWVAWSIYMPIYLSDLGYSAFYIGLLISISMLVIVLMELPVGRAIDSIHSKYIIIPGFFLMWISGYLFLMTSNFLKLVVTRSLVRAGNFLNWEPLLARLSEATPNSKHSSAVSIFRGSVHITSGVFAFIWGYVASIHGIKFVLFTVSSLALIAGIIAMFLRRNVKRKGRGIWRRHHYAHLATTQTHKKAFVKFYK